ncbi:hypothetical protein SGPA1_10026 [Streptomyces misionensis JCM 4497]
MGRRTPDRGRGRPPAAQGALRREQRDVLGPAALLGVPQERPVDRLGRTARDARAGRGGHHRRRALARLHRPPDARPRRRRGHRLPPQPAAPAPGAGRDPLDDPRRGQGDRRQRLPPHGAHRRRPDRRAGASVRAPGLDPAEPVARTSGAARGAVAGAGGRRPRRGPAHRGPPGREAGDLGARDGRETAVQTRTHRAARNGARRRQQVGPARPVSRWRPPCSQGVCAANYTSFPASWETID